MVVVYDNFLCIVGFYLLIFCWEFLHRYSSEILDGNFLSWWCLCLVLVSGWYWLHRMSLGVFPPLQFFGRVWEGLVYVLLFCYNLPVKSMVPVREIVRSFSITDFTSCVVIGLFKLSVSYWFNFGGPYVSQEVSPGEGNGNPL